MERREEYVNLLESRLLGLNLSDLVHLVKQCLHNDPLERPNADELLCTLQRMKVEVEGDYGSPFRLDMERAKLAKEVKAKSRRIEELTQQLVNWHGVKLLALHVACLQVTQGAELQEKARAVDALQVRMANIAMFWIFENIVGGVTWSYQSLPDNDQGISVET